MCLRVSNKKKWRENLFFASLKSLKKGVRFGVGSGSRARFRAGSRSISQRYGSLDPDPHQMSWIPNTGAYTLDFRCSKVKSV